MRGYDIPISKARKCKVFTNPVLQRTLYNYKPGLIQGLKVCGILLSFKMRTILFSLCISCLLTVKAQTNADCLRQQLKTGQADDLDKLSGELISLLPEKDFYIVGEAHTFLANSDLQWSLAKVLHSRGVYNVVNELPHAACFLFNQYLITGDQSILDSLLPTASYDVLKKIRNWNLSQPQDKQIRYYGIDYLHPNRDFKNYQLSLKIILGEAKSGEFAADALIRDFIAKDNLTKKEVAAFNEKLAAALEQDKQLAAAHYGPHYADLKLMISNMIGYRSNRDELIYKSFLVLYENLRGQSAIRPKFFAFYGLGHLNNLANKLDERKSSPVYENLARIGIKYFNCIGGWTNPYRRDEGISNFQKKTLQQLKAFSDAGSWKVGIAPAKGCFEYKNGARYDAIIIFNNYGDRSMRSWKFD